MKTNITLTKQEQKRILGIEILDEGLIYNINGYEFTFDLPKEIVDFIQKHSIGVRDFIEVKNQTTKTLDKNAFNIERNYSERVVKINGNSKKIIEYSYSTFVLSEYKLIKHINEILSNIFPHLNIYMSELEIPTYGYLKNELTVFGNFNGNKIHKYETPTIIEFLKDGKREFQQKDFFQRMRISYWINKDNECKKGNFKDLIKEIEDTYIKC